MNTFANDSSMGQIIAAVNGEITPIRSDREIIGNNIHKRLPGG
jgi:hypothetical protein